MDQVSPYRKFYVAVAGAVVVGVGRYFGVDSDWYTVAVAVATALGVYAVPNAD